MGLDVAAYNQARLVLHTHFVRSGYVMLPVWPATIHGAQRGYKITDPLLTKWVFAKRETLTDILSVVGRSITDPPLTRWVCAKPDAHPVAPDAVNSMLYCRLRHSEFALNLAKEE